MSPQSMIWVDGFGSLIVGFGSWPSPGARLSSRKGQASIKCGERLVRDQASPAGVGKARQ
jgi:hypothetical protein